MRCGAAPPWRLARRERTRGRESRPVAARRAQLRGTRAGPRRDPRGALSGLPAGAAVPGGVSPTGRDSGETTAVSDVTSTWNIGLAAPSTFHVEHAVLDPSVQERKDGTP